MSVYYASWTRRLGFAHYDACTVASTDYAASYIAPTGASPMGQIKTPLGQRVYRAMKRIREEILNRCSSFEAFCAVFYTSTLDPPVGVGMPVYASPLVYKRETLTRGGVKPSWAEDSLIHTKSNTSHSGRRVLRSGGPNYSKPDCSCVLAPKLDRPNCLALSQVLSLWD